jgi:hypothetical protein
VSGSVVCPSRPRGGRNIFCAGSYQFCARQSIISVSGATTPMPICGRPSILPPQDGRSSCYKHASASTGRAGFVAVGSKGDGEGGVTTRRLFWGTRPAMPIILPATRNGAAPGSAIPPESSTLRGRCIYGAVRFFYRHGGAATTTCYVPARLTRTKELAVVSPQNDAICVIPSTPSPNSSPSSSSMDPKTSPGRVGWPLEGSAASRARHFRYHVNICLM